jgi:hypothetical protein
LETEVFQAFDYLASIDLRADEIITIRRNLVKLTPWYDGPKHGQEDGSLQREGKTIPHRAEHFQVVPNHLTPFPQDSHAF